MKRLTLLALAAALLCMLLTGCAGTNSADGYRGNVSTTDNGRVNGTNEGMTGMFTGEEGFGSAMDGTEGVDQRGNQRGQRSWHDGTQHGGNDSANGGDTNTGNPHNAVGDGLYSGRGGNNGANGSQSGRPTPRSGSRPADR